MESSESYVIGDLPRMMAGRRDRPDRASNGDDSARRPVAPGVEAPSSHIGEGTADFGLRRLRRFAATSCCDSRARLRSLD